VEGLEFVGQITGDGEANLLLLYPTGDNRPAARPRGWRIDRVSRKLAGAKQPWVETTVILDFSKAKKIAVPGDGKRQTDRAPGRDDLEGLWAVAQAAHFHVQEHLAPEIGFYSFARETTGRKYRVPTANLPRWWGFGREHSEVVHVYETTTGAAAITESLALERKRGQSLRDTGKREIDLARVPGIDVAEHPWERIWAATSLHPSRWPDWCRTTTTS
jgi:hypothetical protein